MIYFKVIWANVHDGCELNLGGWKRSEQVVRPIERCHHQRKSKISIRQQMFTRSFRTFMAIHMNIAAESNSLFKE